MGLMDDISRELPPDTTSDAAEQPTGASGAAWRGDERRSVAKGPSEWVAHERGGVADDLVVGRERSGPADGGLGEGGLAREIPMSDSPRFLPDDPESKPQAAEAADAEPATAPTEESSTGLDETGDLVAGDLEVGEPEAIDLTAARAATQAEESSLDEAYEPDAELEEGDDGLPPVPELADAREVAKLVYVLMLSSREGLTMLRLAQAVNTTQKLVEEALGILQQQFAELGLPVELARTGDTVKWLSAPSTFVHLQRLRGVKKLEKLSPAALETLAVIAYRQPVMRSEIEAIRGVKAGPMLRTLLQHKLVKVTGRADVPGRPLQYGTTPLFLERFGIASVQELPSVKEYKNLG